MGYSIIWHPSTHPRGRPRPTSNQTRRTSARAITPPPKPHPRPRRHTPMPAQRHATQHAPKDHDNNTKPIPDSRKHGETQKSARAGRWMRDKVRIMHSAVRLPGQRGATPGNQEGLSVSGSVCREQILFSFQNCRQCGADYIYNAPWKSRPLTAG